MFAGAISPKFGDGHSRKRYAPELLASRGRNIDVNYDQHTQIITELDVINWISGLLQLKSYYTENQLKQNKILKIKLWPDSGIKPRT